MKPGQQVDIRRGTPRGPLGEVGVGAVGAIGGGTGSRRCSLGRGERLRRLAGKRLAVGVIGRLFAGGASAEPGDRDLGLLGARGRIRERRSCLRFGRSETPQLPAELGRALRAGHDTGASGRLDPLRQATATASRCSRSAATAWSRRSRSASSDRSRRCADGRVGQLGFGRARRRVAGSVRRRLRRGPPARPPRPRASGGAPPSRVGRPRRCRLRTRARRAQGRNRSPRR